MFNNRLRWFILGWLFIITLVSYMDRVNLSVAVPLIMKEFHLNASQIGVVISGLTIGYTIMNFPGGFLADRFSPKWILVIALILWSLLTIATGLAWSFASLFIIRILFGASEGPLGPCNTKIVSQWMLPRERGTASGLWLSAMTLGMVVGAPLSAYIIHSYGWRSVFYIFGVGGIGLALLTTYLLQSKPEEHPWIDKHELAVIREHNYPEKMSVQKESSGKLLLAVFSSPLAWLLALTYFGLTALYWANVGWLPTYFVKARGSNILSSGLYSALPYFSASLGPVIIGALSDRLFKGWRSPLLITVSIITVPFVFIAVNAAQLETSLIAFCLAAFFDFAGIGLMWALSLELFPKERVAAASGFMLMWGSAAGILSPIITGVILQNTGSFNHAYYAFAIAALFSAILAVGLLLREKELRNLKGLTGAQAGVSGS
ncbi:MAG: MFS transporter [Thermoanaerobacteraceae bacterium]|nr:MFS transporter [Thermoanaerobacteraceae bacterium]